MGEGVLYNMYQKKRLVLEPGLELSNKQAGGCIGTGSFVQARK